MGLCKQWDPKPCHLQLIHGAGFCFWSISLFYIIIVFDWSWIRSYCKFGD